MKQTRNVKKCFGGGGNSSILLSLGKGFVVMPRCFGAAKQQGSEAAKRNSHCEAKSYKSIVEIFENPLSQSHSIKEAVKFYLIRESEKFLSLTKRKLYTLAQRTLPNKTIDNCFMRGESSRLNEVNYGYERGVQGHKNSDRATECAMTDVGENFLKIPSHSEDNNILSPKNLLKRLQEDLSLNAQDDKNVETFEPSPAFVAFALAH